jgi:hypothetical protein
MAQSSARAVKIPGAEPVESTSDAPQPDKVTGPATAPVEQRPGPEPVAGLRAVDVDPHKIKRAVLTLDGWVCPAIAPGFGGER